VRSILALAAALISQTAVASAPRTLDYLYIEANEGGSSGGHSAIRFGDETYHFQHESPGVLRLHRDDWQHFRYAYGVLENRTMHVSRVAVSDAAYARLRQAFNERYLGERRVFAHRDALRDDRLLLELLQARRRGDRGGTILVRGAGFFFPEDGSVHSVAALSLRRHVQDTYGADTIRQRDDDVRAELAHLAPTAFGPATVDLPTDGYPAFPYPFSSRYRDRLTALIALHVLDRALPLRPGSYWSAAAGFDLDPTERRRLAGYADRLTEELTRLVRSDRPDWGFAFLVGMARLQTLRASDATGRWVFLDAFPPGSDVIPASYIRQHRAAVSGLRAEADEDFARARAHFRAAETDEAGFAEIESAANRLLELDAALAGDHDLRVSGDALVPSRDAPWSRLVVPDVTRDELASALARTTAVEKRFDARLHERFGYDLVTRNCVSEIFRTVEAAAADPGGRVDTRWSLDFIPFVAAGAVNSTWNVVQRGTLPSYRRSRLDDMSRRESALRVRLRESNVLTSTIYHRSAEDSFFLFFTDDVVALRPLFGAINLVSGLGATALGLPLLPFDRGEIVMSGMRGTLFSLPELAFVNLRKGSFDYVPRDRRPDTE
jgi:hypothetical protein